MEKGSTLLSALFRLSMWWRIFYGACNVILGAVLLQWVTLDPAALFYRLMRHEIIEDPEDVFLRIVRPMVEHLSVGTQVFIGLYLIFWGVLDVVLSVNILRKKLWAFPTALGLIGVFVAYEIYRVTYTHSLILAFFIALDIAILWIIHREYKILKESHHPLHP